MLNKTRFVSFIIPILIVLTIFQNIDSNESFMEPERSEKLNIPLSSSEEYTKEVPPDFNAYSVRGNEAVTFTNVSKQANISQFSGNYFAWGDYNNDNYQDLLVNGKRLLRNNGPPGWNFTDVTSTVNISYSGSINVGVWGDWNNDRYLDFFAAGGGWTTDTPTTYDVLWKNSGPPNYTFEDYTHLAGGVRDSYPSVAAGWGDYDQDGFIDLYIGNYENTGLVGYPDTFWHNNGNGTFSEVTTSSGIGSIDNRPARGVAWCDYNNDGWQDIYISNYRLKGNALWENQHDGTFINVAPDQNCQGLAHYYQGSGPYYGHTIGSAWGDLNNDGNMDLWVSNLVHKYVGGSDIRGYICDDSNLYLNNGGPHYTFQNIRETSGIPKKPVGPQGVYQGDELWSGVAIGDFDNDGDQDVWVPQIYDLNYAYSFLFRNNNDNTFTDVAQSQGLRVYNNYGSAWCDFNNDGFLDLVTGGKSPFIAEGSGSYEIHLFKNNGNVNNWFKLRLTGFLSNNKGIGTKVILTTNQGTQYRQLDGGMGSHSQQNGLVLHFGLGSATSIQKLTIEWPNGRANIHYNLPINMELELVEEVEGPKINSISVSSTNITEDQTINFDGSATDPDGSITKYEWDFDGDNIYDWSSPTTAKTSFTFTKSGRYFAKLRAWDDSNRCYTFRSTDLITVNNIAPTAEAGNDIVAYEDDNITLNGSLSTDTPTDRADLEYNWSFDDGSYSGWNHSWLVYHSYFDNGEYNVQLYVRDDDNVISMDSLTVNILNRKPSVKITAPALASEDQKVIFSAEIFDSPSDLPFIMVRWDYGDGNNTYWSTQNITEYTYVLNGNYNVKCIVRDDDWPEDENQSTIVINIYNIIPTCWYETKTEVVEDEKVYFYCLGNDTPSDIVTLKYFWDFADGTTSGWLRSYEKNTTHTYTNQGIYHVKLLVQDDEHAQCIKTINISVRNIPPQVQGMDQDYIELFEDDSVLFYGSGKDTISDKDSLMFSWSINISGFQDTTWNYSAEFEYIFKYSGEYLATLTVRDDNGATDKTSVRISVANVKPKAIFLVSETNINEDAVLYLDATDSEDTPSDLVTLNFTWDFDDGSLQRYGPIQQHNFTKAAEYRIKLTVTDDDKEYDVLTIKIKVNNVKPKAVISTSELEVYINQPITFNAYDSSDSPSDMDSLIYSWDFDDGSRETGDVVTHAFTTPGRYQVILTVTDDNKASGTDSVSIKVNEIKIDGTDSQTGDGQSISGMITYIIIIVIIIIIILVLVALIYLKKRSINKKMESEGELKQTTEPTITGQQMPVPMSMPIPPYIQMQMAMQNQIQGQMQMPGPFQVQVAPIIYAKPLSQNIQNKQEQQLTSTAQESQSSQQIQTEEKAKMDTPFGESDELSKPAEQPQLQPVKKRSENGENINSE